MEIERYQILLTDDALSALKKFDKAIAERIKKKLGALCTMPPARTLKRQAEVFVLEIGQYRALYLTDRKAKTKTVFFIADHKEYEKRYLRMFK